jgi:hypothetical protein
MMAPLRPRNIRRRRPTTTHILYGVKTRRKTPENTAQNPEIVVFPALIGLR